MTWMRKRKRKKWTILERPLRSQYLSRKVGGVVNSSFSEYLNSIVMPERFSLDTLYRSCIYDWRFLAVFCKVAWSRGQQLKNLLHWITMVAETETMPIQKKTLRWKKKAHDCREFKSRYRATSDSFTFIRTAGQIKDWITLNSPKTKTIDQSPANPRGSSFYGC